MGGGRTRVLHVLPDLAVGGGQTIVLDHLRHADRSRFEVDVVHLHPPGDLAGAFADAGSPPCLLPTPTSRRTIAELRRRVRVADVVHVHSDEDRKLAQLAALGTGVPVVGHLHSEWVHLGGRQLPDAPRRRKVRGFVTGSVRDAVERLTVAHYVAASAGVERLFRPLVARPVTVLRPAVDLDRFDGAADRAAMADLRTQIGVGTGPVLVSVGRMARGKGHLFVLEAFRPVLDADPSATLVLVGDGTERAAVEARAAELGVASALRVLGTRHDVPEILSLADVFVFASESEGFGLAVLEAMAAARPVVAFRLPAIEEFATDGESAFLVEPGDLDGFVSSVQKLLSDRALAADLGRAGRAMVERRFPAGAVARTFEEVYDDVLAARRGRGASAREGPARRAARAAKPAVRRVWRNAVLARAADETDGSSRRTAVVVAPHPDDETLGCGATIARKRAAGTRVVVVVVTDGRHSHPSGLVSPGQLAALRADEVRAACARLGVEPGDVHLLGYEEGTVGARHDSVTGRIADLVAEVRPDEVFTTCASDWHLDHQAVSAAVRAAVAAVPDRPRLLEFPIWFWVDGPWTPGSAGGGPVFRYLADPVRASRLRAVKVRTGEHLGTKRAALAEFRTQTTNVTGEREWAIMDDRVLELFLGDSEVFLPVDEGASS